MCCRFVAGLHSGRAELPRWEAGGRGTAALEGSEGAAASTDCRLHLRVLSDAGHAVVLNIITAASFPRQQKLGTCRGLGTRLCVHHHILLCCRFRHNMLYCFHCGLVPKQWVDEAILLFIVFVSSIM